MYILYCEDCAREFQSETRHRRLCDDCKSNHCAVAKKTQIEGRKKPKKQRVRKISTKSIEDMSWLARKAGLTYGKYVALHPELAKEVI